MSSIYFYCFHESLSMQKLFSRLEPCSSRKRTDCVFSLESGSATQLRTVGVSSRPEKRAKLFFAKVSGSYLAVSHTIKSLVHPVFACPLQLAVWGRGPFALMILILGRRATFFFV